MKIKPEQNFVKKFDLFISHMWHLQDRVDELKEFEKQLESLFDLLRQKTGSECRIDILNQQLFRTFRWDKYHVLVNDLFSLMENELNTDNPEGIIRLSANHLKIRDFQEY